MLADAHCHIDEYTQDELATVLARAREKGIEAVVGNGVTLNSSKKTVAMAQTNKAVWTAVGIHPWYIQPVDESTYQELKVLTGQPRVAFIGEVGLDLNRTPETIEVQKQALKQQIRLAREVNLPLNIHSGLAHKELIEILKGQSLPDPPGLIHGFNGDLATIKAYVDIGFCISLGRSLLQPLPELEEALRWLPMKWLLVETDSTARSLRERGYEPATVTEVTERAAALKGTTATAIKRAVSRNFNRLVK